MRAGGIVVALASAQGRGEMPALYNRAAADAVGLNVLSTFKSGPDTSDVGDVRGAGQDESSLDRPRRNYGGANAGSDQLFRKREAEAAKSPFGSRIRGFVRKRRANGGRAYARDRDNSSLDRLFSKKAGTVTNGAPGHLSGNEEPFFGLRRLGGSHDALGRSFGGPDDDLLHGRANGSSSGSGAERAIFHAASPLAGQHFTIDPVFDGVFIAGGAAFTGLLGLILSTGEVKPSLPEPTSNLLSIDRLAVTQHIDPHAGTYSG